MWVPDVVFEWPKGHYNLKDQIINIKKLEKICTENPNNIYLETLALVTHIARKQNVQILVRMIPYWIKQRIEQICRQAGYEPPVICTPEELLAEE